MKNVLEKAKGRFVTVTKGNELYNGKVVSETPCYVRFVDRNTQRMLTRHKSGLSIRCGGSTIL